jgi:hypothetical protein
MLWKGKGMLTQEARPAQVHGLGEQGAGERLPQEGYNELASHGRRGLLGAALEVAREPMFLLLIAIVLAVFRLSLAFGAPEAEARALTFTTLVVANLGLVLATRSRTRTILAILRTPNAAVWWVVGGAALLALVLGVPFLRDLFGFATLHLSDLLICEAAGLASSVWFEGVKVVRRRWILARSQSATRSV